VDDRPAPGTTTGSIVPPIVPGRQGIRTPALPGRAGAMAGSTSGGISTTGIKRPHDNVGRATGAVSVGRATGTVVTGRATGAVTGAPGATSEDTAPRRPADPAALPGAGRTGPGTAGDDAVGAEPRGAGGLGGVRSELRRQMRQKRRLRMLVLAGLTLLVLGALPMFFGIRSASRDPVFHSLDALGVPAYAASTVEDNGSGSRWCFLDCRFRERTAQSQKPIPETAKIYGDALTKAGWQPWKVDGCPEQPVTDGSSYSCWRRDEFTLDLWVRQPACQVDAFAAQDPAVAPSRNADGTVPTADPATCNGSTVSIKVQNAVTDLRGRSEPRPGPPLVGETPDAVLSEDPLLEATPSPS
jgi:integrin beta 3